MATLPDRNGLFAEWHLLTSGGAFGQQTCHEMDERGEAVPNLHPSARCQIVLTDIFGHLTGQIGHPAAMSAAVTTPSFGIRRPDVIRMSPGKCETSGQDDPVPFVPDLCWRCFLTGTRSRIWPGGSTRIRQAAPAKSFSSAPMDSLSSGAPACLQQVSRFGIALPLERIYFDARDLPSARRVASRR